MLIDTHCHIQLRAYDAEREAVVRRSLEKGMILNVVGTQTDTSRLAVDLAESFDGVYATIGTHPIHLHPTHVDEEETRFMSREEGFDETHYEKLARSAKVIGVGECGLDLFHMPKDKPVEEVLGKQKEVFLAHARFAERHALPLVIHCREAHDEMIELLKGYIAPVTPASPMLSSGPLRPRSEARGRGRLRGTVHCYTSGWDHAQEYLKLGLYLGFTGVITFPPKKTDPRSQNELLEVVRKVPLERALVETDAPYLAPQAYRGTRAEPWMAEEVVKKVAECKGLSVAEVAAAIMENSLRLFDRIKKTA